MEARFSEDILLLRGLCLPLVFGCSLPLLESLEGKFEDWSASPTLFKLESTAHSSDWETPQDPSKEVERDSDAFGLWFHSPSVRLDTIESNYYHLCCVRKSQQNFFSFFFFSYTDNSERSMLFRKSFRKKIPWIYEIFYHRCHHVDLSQHQEEPHLSLERTKDHY